MWKMLEDNNVVRNRSWESMKERFRKVRISGLLVFAKISLLKRANIHISLAQL